jgi:hypothetical protein
MIEEPAGVPATTFNGAAGESAPIAQECLESLYNEALTRDRLGIGYELAKERQPCSCRPSQALLNMFAGPPLAPPVQRAPVPGRFPDHLDGYSSPAKEVRLKNNGKEVVRGAPNGGQSVVLAREMSKISFALCGIPCGSVSRDSSRPRKELVEHGRLLP